MKKLLVSLGVCIAYSISGHAGSMADWFSEICSKTVTEVQGSSGTQYQTAAARFSKNEQLVARALPVGNQIELSVTGNQLNQSWQLPYFQFSRIQVTEDSVWFLSGDSLTEFSISQGKILGKYPSFPKNVQYDLTGSARGIAYSGGYLYIAHGEHGVVLFDAKNRKHYSVIASMVQPGSMAAAVQVRGNYLYLLQGAYHPAGANGISVVDLSNGTNKFVAYHATSGVVDPYSSTLIVNGSDLVANNSGWIHQFSLSELHKGVSPQYPKWIPVVETLESQFGKVDYHLMVNGDLLAFGKELLACSLVSYVPKGGKKPIKESRLIHKSY